MILSLLLGECRLAAPLSQSAALLELCRAHGLRIYAQERETAAGELRFSCRLSGARRLQSLASAAGVSLRELARKGAPVRVLQLLRRPGLLAGCAVALLIQLLSPLFLWEVEISGNETVPTEELERELALAGLARGCFLPLVDGDAVSSSLRRADARLAFVAVNLRGTVALVQVREAEPEPEPPETSPADLVACRDGVVVLPLIYEGQCLVRAGDTVRAGQLLASGILESEGHGTRLTRATGEVLARTVRTYTVRVPYEYTALVPTAREGREISLRFFGKTQKVYKTTGNISDRCDIIYTDTDWRLPGGRALPFGIGVTRVVFFDEILLRRDTAEAICVANEQLSALLAAESESFALVQRTTQMLADESGVTLCCTVICEENIAVSAELSAADGAQ